MLLQNMASKNIELKESLWKYSGNALKFCVSKSQKYRKKNRSFFAFIDTLCHVIVLNSGI